ncbi:MAG: substrate-binding domain-containing protein [Aigarchaeota archaeon]|nr:substrate-binding domain-containing protein [Aigarchaeota archaeon]MDW8092787.1 hypothetical protein [Nitrososphaerota archaeon]
MNIGRRNLAVLLAVFAALISISALWGRIGEQERSGPVIYVAPTLTGLVREVLSRAPADSDVRVIGSVISVQLIREGRRPDVLLLADNELERFLPDYRNRVSLGSYRLIALCRENLTLNQLIERTIALADPNVAPIGYRAVAALYYLLKVQDPAMSDRLQVLLGINVNPIEGGVLLDLRGLNPSRQFILRNDLSEVSAIFEAGLVDCIFVHEPFAMWKGLIGRYHVIDLPPEIEFTVDPPMRFIARLRVGDVEVRKFEASAVSFTERGDRILEMMGTVELERHGLMRVGP